MLLSRLTKESAVLLATSENDRQIISDLLNNFGSEAAGKVKLDPYIQHHEDGTFSWVGVIIERDEPIIAEEEDGKRRRVIFTDSEKAKKVDKK